MDSSQAEAQLQTLLEGVLYHEAAHAVLGAELGRKIERITCSPFDAKSATIAKVTFHILPDLAPSANLKRDPAKRALAEEQICIYLSGPLAEEKSHRLRATGFTRHPDGAAMDDAQARTMALRIVDAKEMDNLLAQMTDRTRQMLEEPKTWVKVEALARKILGNLQLKQAVISGEEVHAIIGGRVR